MVHIFSTNLGKDHDPDDAASYVGSWSSEEAHEALTLPNSSLFVKIDGSCGLLVRDPSDGGRWKIYQRYDDKKNKFEDGKSIPDGYIKCPGGQNPLSYQFIGGYTKHSYYMKLLERKPKGKTEFKINSELYKIVDGKVLDGNYISIELCGKNFNQTPGVVENTIALHRDQTLAEPLKRPSEDTSDAWKTVLIDYFTRYPCEGIIVRHPNGKYFKILSRLLGVEHANGTHHQHKYLPPRHL